MFKILFALICATGLGAFMFWLVQDGNKRHAELQAAYEARIYHFIGSDNLPVTCKNAYPTNANAGVGSCGYGFAGKDCSDGKAYACVTNVSIEEGASPNGAK